jgi:hypothetical protein
MDWCDVSFFSVPPPNKFMGTPPKSWREQNLITSRVEMEDKDELAKRRELVQSKSPAQLSQMGGLGDFPVPEKIQNMMKKKEKPVQEGSKKRR